MTRIFALLRCSLIRVGLWGKVLIEVKMIDDHLGYQDEDGKSWALQSLQKIEKTRVGKTWQLISSR